nr:hypothetical protein [Pandoravirus massiliensis]
MATGLLRRAAVCCRPLIDRNIIVYLCEWAIRFSGSATLEILDMLHCRFYGGGRCRCPLRLAYAAARADRIDIIAWMCATNCAARPDTNTSSEMNVMIDVAINAKACSVVH